MSIVKTFFSATRLTFNAYRYLCNLSSSKSLNASLFYANEFTTRCSFSQCCNSANANAKVGQCSINALNWRCHVFANFCHLTAHSQKNTNINHEQLNFSETADSQNDIEECELDSKMVKILNVAEKNDASKNLANILSRGGSIRREGISQYNKIYEFPYQLQGQTVQMVFTSVSGHLLNQEFVGSYKRWHSCSPLDLFSAPVVKGVKEESMEKIKRTLEREVRGASKLIIWTDCDREGENIGFEIISVCQAVKPNIVILRARFSEITPASVNRAINNLIQPDRLQSQAVDVRSELDLRIGAAFTRFQTLRLQKVFPASLADTLISYGSCQFPTLGFVVQRYKAIQDFVAENFWKIKATHHHPDGTVEFSWLRVRLFDELCCQVLLDTCLEAPQATVTSVTSKPKSKWRPLPLDTVEFEKLASRKLRISAKDAMKIAEKLYTSGVVSYPRTETNIFPKDLDLVPLVEMQTVDNDWGAFASHVLERGPNPRQGKKTDEAHPPIHPTRHAPSLAGDEKRVYELITRSFLACVSDDARGHETVVEFRASGLIILEKNYLEVYPYDRWCDKPMPHYEVGFQFTSELAMVGGQTTPPALLTEADLIALMEKHGIGTDATHAEHIETIKTRSYVGLQQDSRFVPGTLGMGLVNGYDNMGFEMSRPHLRAGLEEDLKAICEGRRDPAVVLQEQVAKYKEVFEEAMRQANKLDAALATLLEEAPAPDSEASMLPSFQQVGECGHCGNPIVVKQKRNGGGFFLSCQGFPDCRVCLWLPDDVTGVTVLEDVCTQCPGRPPLLRLTFKPRAYSPILPDAITTCMHGCDTMVLDTLGVRALPRRGAAAENRGGRGGGATIRGQGGLGGLGGGGVGGGRGGHGGGFKGRGGNAVVATARRGRATVTANRSRGATATRARGRAQAPAPASASVTSVGGAADPDWGDVDWSVDGMDFSDDVWDLNGDEFEALSGAANGRVLANRGAVTGRGLAFGSATGRGLSSRGAASARGFANDNAAVGCSMNTVIRPSLSGGRGNNTINVGGDTWDTRGRGSTNVSSSSNNNNNNNNSSSSGYSSQSQNTSSQSNNREFGWVGDDNPDNRVVCNCGDDALLLTVRKEGPNTGRQFYKCPRPQGTNCCGFFLWADDGGRDGGGGNVRFGASSQSSSNYSSSFNSSNNRGNNTRDSNEEQEEDSRTCSCGTPAVRRTVQKEGPNTGREFYVCSKGRSEQCNFFEWADAPTGGGGWSSGGSFGSSAGRGGGWRGGQGRGRAPGRRGGTGAAPGGGPAKKRKCGVCGQEGHNRKNCPSNDY